MYVGMQDCISVCMYTSIHFCMYMYKSIYTKGYISFLRTHVVRQLLPSLSEHCGIGTYPFPENLKEHLQRRLEIGNATAEI